MIFDECHLLLKILIGVASTERPKNRGIRKSGMICFIYQVSNEFQQIYGITPDNLVHCGYSEYDRFSGNEKINKIWLVSQDVQL